MIDFQQMARDVEDIGNRSEAKRAAFIGPKRPICVLIHADGSITNLVKAK